MVTRPWIAQSYGRVSLDVLAVHAVLRHARASNVAECVAAALGRAYAVGRSVACRLLGLQYLAKQVWAGAYALSPSGCRDTLLQQSGALLAYLHGFG